jgi:hypothetical protein
MEEVLGDWKKPALKKLSLIELKDVASRHDVKGRANLNKADLIKLIAKAASKSRKIMKKAQEGSVSSTSEDSLAQLHHHGEHYSDYDSHSPPMSNYGSDGSSELAANMDCINLSAGNEYYVRYMSVFQPLYEHHVHYPRRPACLRSNASFVHLQELHRECDTLGLLHSLQRALKFVSNNEKAYRRRGLSLEQTVVLRLYSMESEPRIYKMLNEALLEYRPHMGDIQEMRCMLTLLQSAIYKLSHTANNTLYRGMAVKLDDDMYQRILDGDIFRIWFPTFQSCSFKKFVSEQFLSSSGHNVVFRIKTWMNGARMNWISAHPHEDELLLPAYTLFQIAGHRFKTGYLEIDLEWVHM